MRCNPVFVYICSPLRGDMEANMDKAREYCREAMRKARGAGMIIPIAPHIYFTQFLDDYIQHERELGMQAGLQMLRLCSKVWVLGDRISEGMQAEIEFAKSLGIPVFDFTEGTSNA